MTWLTWRQQRLESLIGGFVIGLAAIVLFWTGRTMISSYDHGGSAACVANHSTDDACSSVIGEFQRQFNHLNSLTTWMNFLPLFVGLLLAAPLILEFEQGTHRLAWTQSITRRRWLATKLAWKLGAAIAVSLGLTLLWTWWRGPFDALQGRFDNSAFDFEGIVPVAYTLFALAVCLTAGVLLRRTAPAMAITFAVFLGLRLFTENKLRSHYLAPLKLVWDPTSATPAAALDRLRSGDWVLSQGFVLQSDGTATPARQVLQACGLVPMGNGKTAQDIGLNTCLHAHSIMSSIVYQPADRFWIFQGIESAIFLGLAAVLLGFTVWWILRRVA